MLRCGRLMWWLPRLTRFLGLKAVGRMMVGMFCHPCLPLQHICNMSCGGARLVYSYNCPRGFVPSSSSTKQHPPNMLVSQLTWDMMDFIFIRRAEKPSFIFPVQSGDE